MNIQEALEKKRQAKKWFRSLTREALLEFLADTAYRLNELEGAAILENENDEEFSNHILDAVENVNAAYKAETRSELPALT